MTTRRLFLKQSALALAAARSALPQQLSAPATIVRAVAQGSLLGEVSGGVQIFRGVPYAEPPVGGLRFRAPRRPLRWTGVRSATTYAAAATQVTTEKFQQSEDCLYLNLWAPTGAGPHPVFVWIHGGGFTGGRPTEPLYDGTQFARAGIVCITVAYRLGVFGFLDVSKFFGPTYTGSADNALLDLMAALRWIQSNVATFGGDPARVTIGGESAGAKLTDILIGVPEAQPLFHQMISESGGAERVWAEADAQEIAEGFGTEWTRRTSLPVSELLSADAGKIVKVQGEFINAWSKHFPLRPERNATLMPDAPLTAIRRGSARGKRLLVGTNRDESALFLGPKPKAVTAWDLGNLTLAQFEPVEMGYRTTYPKDSDAKRRIRAVTAEEYWIPSLRVADAHTRAGGETYVYRLDLPGTGRFEGLAFHSYDLRFVWNFFGDDQPSSAQQKLANGMHAAWIAFIKGERPAGPGLPDWPRYSAKDRPTMILDDPSRVELNPDEAEFRLWNGLLND